MKKTGVRRQKSEGSILVFMLRFLAPDFWILNSDFFPKVFLSETDKIITTGNSCGRPKLLTGEKLRQWWQVMS